MNLIPFSVFQFQIPSQPPPDTIQIQIQVLEIAYTFGLLSLVFEFSPGIAKVDPDPACCQIAYISQVEWHKSKCTCLCFGTGLQEEIQQTNKHTKPYKNK